VAAVCLYLYVRGRLGLRGRDLFHLPLLKVAGSRVVHTAGLEYKSGALLAPLLRGTLLPRALRAEQRAV
jgi:hypothetical protein